MPIIMSRMSGDFDGRVLGYDQLVSLIVIFPLKYILFTSK